MRAGIFFSGRTGGSKSASKWLQKSLKIKNKQQVSNIFGKLAQHGSKWGHVGPKMAQAQGGVNGVTAKRGGAVRQQILRCVKKV